MSEQASATVRISFVDGTYTVYAQTEGSSREAAHKLAHDILHFLADGRAAFVRCEPEASTERNHDSQQELHRGFVRFSFKNTGGAWNKAVDDGPAVLSLGWPGAFTPKIVD